MWYCIRCSAQMPVGAASCASCGAEMSRAPQGTFGAAVLPTTADPPRESAHRDVSADREILSLLAEDNLIAAIKRYRELTGAGLADAKRAVEAIRDGMPAAMPAPARAQPASVTDVPDVLPLIEQGRLIEAIKLYRERTGVGLKEAKDAVEAMRDALR